MKTTQEVVAAFEIAALKAGLARNTCKTYAPVIAEFSRMMKSGEILGVQDYLDHLASVKKLSSNSVWHALNPLKRNRSKPMRAVQSPLDTAARRNLSPLRRSA